MLDPKTKARIAQDAKAHWLKTSGDQGELDYIAGAEAEATRAQPLIEAYRELHSISNDQLNEMEKLIKDYKPDREKISRAYELLKKIEALANYNNPK